MTTLRNISNFPAPSKLLQLSKAKAALEVLIEPEWQFRYFSHNAAWSEGEEMGSCRDGSGYEHFLVFNKQGVFGVGYGHYPRLNTPRKDDDIDWRTSQVPACFRSQLKEAAFDMAFVSFCIWHENETDGWSCGTPPEDHMKDVDLEKLGLLVADALSFRGWVEEYHEREIALETIEEIFGGGPITLQHLELFDRLEDADSIRAELEEIGFPNSL